MKKSIIIHPDELTEPMIGILRRAGIERVGLHPAGGNVAAQSAKDFVELWKTPEFQRKLRLLREAGISVEYEMHALSYLMPRALFAVHPDWFREDRSGRRTADGNLCPSNREALAFLSAQTEALVREVPSDTGKYYLWTDDAQGRSCHCAACRRLSDADQALIITNAMLRGIRTVDPAGAACYLAYVGLREDGSPVGGTMLPPSRVRPEPGVFLEFAPMRKDTKTPFATQSGNRPLLAALPRLFDFFGRENAQALEYWMDNSMYSGWKKPPVKLEICPETVRADIGFYKRAGFASVTSFGCYLSDDYAVLYGEPPIAAYARCFD